MKPPGSVNCREASVYATSFFPNIRISSGLKNLGGRNTYIFTDAAPPFHARISYDNPA